MDTPIFDVDLSKRFGKTQVLENIRFQVEPKRIPGDRRADGVRENDPGEHLGRDRQPNSGSRPDSRRKGQSEGA